MQFKIDENLHINVADYLRQQGYDAMTVNEQGLQGQSDDVIANICQQESRVLVTLDLDFADMRCYPPNRYAGIFSGSHAPAWEPALTAPAVNYVALERCGRHSHAGAWERVKTLFICILARLT